LLTFGHALYYAVGAYTAGFAVKFLGVHDGLVILALAVVTGAAASALLGLLLARYRGMHFGLLNLAYSMVLYSILPKFYAVTGGTDGLRLPTPLLAGVKPAAAHLRLTIYYVTVVLTALLLYVAYRFTASPLGYTLRALRDNEVRVEYMGASVRQAIYCSYIVAGVLASVGGVLAGFSVGPVLGTVGLTKFFGMVRAAEDLSLRFQEGELVGIVGPNGSGKTTLLNVITGYVKPDRGRIRFQGKDITGLLPRAVADLGIA